MQLDTDPWEDLKEEKRKVYELQKLLERIQSILRKYSANESVKAVREEIEIEINKAFNIF